MKTLIQTKHPTPDIQHQTPNGATSAVLPLMVLLFSCFCRPVSAADVPPAAYVLDAGLKVEELTLDEFARRAPAPTPAPP